MAPRALYNALLTRPFPNAQLPTGFANAKVGLLKPGDTGRKHHVVGEVQIDVDGADALDEIVYLVFPTAADARADINSALDKEFHIVPGGVPGYTSLPSHVWAGAITGKNAFGQKVTNGITSMVVVTDNVVVASITASADNTARGNVPAALALLRAGMRHLRATRAGG